MSAANEMEALAHRYVFISGLLKSTTDDFDESEWLFSPNDGGNPAIWILGHLALYRRVILRRLGESIPEEAWEAYFPYSSKVEQVERYPSAMQLLDDFMKNRKRLSAAFQKLTEEELESEWGRKFPDGSTTIRGGLHILHFHESYHVGQIGLLRRIMGKPGLR